MALSVRFEDDVAVLGHFGALLNDPRHFDAVGDLRGLLDEGVGSSSSSCPACASWARRRWGCW